MFNKNKAGHFTTIREKLNHENTIILSVHLSDNRDPEHTNQ